MDLRIFGPGQFYRGFWGDFFSRDRFEIFWNRFEIFGCGVKFLGQVSFIRDSLENIFSRPFINFRESFRNFLYIFRKLVLMIVGHFYESEECQPKWEVNGGKGEF